jgi:hypothetical protein
MKNILQILIAFILILILSYFAFLDVSKNIKDNLLSKKTTLIADEITSTTPVEIKEQTVQAPKVTKVTETVVKEKKEAVKIVIKKVEKKPIQTEEVIIQKETTAIEKPSVSIEKPSARKITIPTVPTAIKSTVKIPVAVKVISVPEVVPVNDIVVPKVEHKKIETKTEGVK